MKKLPELNQSKSALKRVSIQPAEKVAVWPEIFYWVNNGSEALPQALL